MYSNKEGTTNSKLRALDLEEEIRTLNVLPSQPCFLFSTCQERVPVCISDFRSNELAWKHDRHHFDGAFHVNKLI